ncbi:MAG TPA: dipeptidase PepE [Candidatus Krumholzibacteria bacterium]|nr:dipeptidase PepE [Candidatus Krumholzibacteria bacterium]
MSNATQRLLLLSNSRNFGGGYMEHADAWMRAFFAGTRSAAFVPYAGVTVEWDEYERMVAERFAPLGIEVRSIHHAKHPAQEIETAEAVLVGGGNTFHLLKHLYDTGALWAIRARVLSGTPYMGWSAGSNVACPTIKTTNDMPVVEPARFDATRLIPFQVNPHYTDATLPNHGGETRAQRLAEFTKSNPSIYVVGLREGSAVEVSNGTTKLLGPHSARIFFGSREPVEHAPGASMEFLWNVTT